MAYENNVIKPYDEQENLYLPIPCIIKTVTKYRIPGKRSQKSMVADFLLNNTQPNLPIDDKNFKQQAPTDAGIFWGCFGFFHQSEYNSGNHFETRRFVRFIRTKLVSLS